MRWTPDGKHIVFRTSRNELMWNRADGAGDAQRLLGNSASTNPYLSIRTGAN
jgi:Tol biopolymer transport system component